MERKIVVLLLIVIALYFGSLIFISKQHSSKPASPSQLPASSSVQSMAYCRSHDVETLLTLDHAAGNVYGTFTLKNISNKTCQILGNKFIEPQYVSTNTKVVHEGKTQPQAFVLSPNQTLYSQVHYPNGPQCSSETVQLPVTFSYMISPTENIVFKDQMGKAEQLMQACKSQDITEIQIWNMSDKPINGN